MTDSTGKPTESTAGHGLTFWTRKPEFGGAGPAHA
jgi:hypothetical protein